MQVNEEVGTRSFSAELALNGMVVVRENGRELTELTLNDALAALAQEQDDHRILEATIGQTLRALLRQYARVV